MNRKPGGSRSYIAVGRIRKDTDSDSADGILEELAEMLCHLRAVDPLLRGMVLWDVGLVPREDHIEVRYYFRRDGNIGGFIDGQSPVALARTTSGAGPRIGA